MLKIFYGENDEVLYHTDYYFNNSFKSEWLNDDLVKEMIRDVDRSEVLGPYCIQSPVLGQIPPEKLSGGVKTLILGLKRPELFLYASACGDNCAKWWLKIGKIQDVTVNLVHFMDFGDDPFEIYIMNSGEIAHNIYDIFKVTDKYLRRSVEE